MSAMQSTYEDLEAKYEVEETPESILLRVHVPDGFAREHIGAKIEYDSRSVRVHGERSIGHNKRARFNEVYQVPEYCDVNRIKGKFDGKTVIITIPIIPGKVPTQKPKPAEQEEPKSPGQETEPTSEDEKEGTSPQSVTTNDDQAKTIANDQVPKSTTESEEEVDHETSTPPKTTEESMHQNGQEGVSQKATVTKVESEKQVDQETSTPPKDTEESKTQKDQEGIPQKATITKVESEKQIDQDTSTPPKDTEESKPQEGQEGIPPKDTITKVESIKQGGHKASTPPEDTEKFMPQKGQEAISPKATVTTNAKLQGEEKFAREIDENEEKQKVIGKNEVEDHSKKTLESRKPYEKAVVDDSPKKEGKEESKGLDTFEGEKGMETNGKIGSDDVEKKGDKKAIPKSTSTRIKEVAASASQTMTSLARRFNEEDKQKIIYIGAAVLVVALGVYATYKLRSRRP